MLVSSFSILGNFVLEFSDASFLNLACFIFEFLISVHHFRTMHIFFSSLTCLLFSSSQGTQREHFSKILQMSSPAF